MPAQDPVEEAVRKMEAFIRKYNEAHEELKRELREQLKILIHECAKRLADEELVEKTYQTV